jgi:hypothetical protein
MWQYFVGSWYFFPVLVWTIAWKGIALWKSARSGEKWWFVALFIINTVGILEIAYIFYFAKKKGLKNLMD